LHFFFQLLVGGFLANNHVVMVAFGASLSDAGQ
jgi:hypothetical protein